jgi:hypothetical protein
MPNPPGNIKLKDNRLDGVSVIKMVEKAEWIKRLEEGGKRLKEHRNRRFEREIVQSHKGVSKSELEWLVLGKYIAQADEALNGFNARKIREAAQLSTCLSKAKQLYYAAPPLDWDNLRAACNELDPFLSQFRFIVGLETSNAKRRK